MGIEGIEFRRLAIPEVVLLSPKIYRDGRGFFSETYSARVLEELGITADFVQDNHSLSRQKGVVRGLHFQTPPQAQDKLVRVTRGAIFDVAVDIRQGSPTFGRHVSAQLSAQNWQQLFVPKGFAHGFCSLQPDSEVVYKVSDYYAPQCDRGLAWDDKALAIAWPVSRDAVVLSDKDRHHPVLADLPGCFSYEAEPA